MSDAFIEMDITDLQRQMDEIKIKLSKIERDLKSSIMDQVLNEAANKLANEQKRILSTAPTEGIQSLASDISVWKDNKKSTVDKAVYKAGYPDNKIRKSIKYYIIEFGRPGKRGKIIDKKGRRIGRVQPFSHIRAAWFLKKTEINKYIAKRIDQEITERWNG